MPLHAAGIYEGDSQVCVSDYAVSSYTPSLSAVIKAREGTTSISREAIKAILVAEPGAPGQKQISGVKAEVDNVARILRTASANVLNSTDSSALVQAVLSGLPEAHILHLACHGHQNEDPLQSHFSLKDGPLTIEALMAMNLPNAMLAFLSACETAKGNHDQPDQAVHLAASMLFCGFRSVIATMW